MNVSGKGNAFYRDLPFFADFFRSSNTKTVLKLSSKATLASNFLPCLLVNPLMRPVLPLVRSWLIWSSVRFLPAFCRNTTNPQSGLSHLATLLYMLIWPWPHLGQTMPGSSEWSNLSDKERSSCTISLVYSSMPLRKSFALYSPPSIRERACSHLPVMVTSAICLSFSRS